LLGLVSVQTTDQYLGYKQRFRSAVNHDIGIEPDDGVNATYEHSGGLISGAFARAGGNQGIAAGILEIARR
jgi:hypothetical protein